MAWVGKLVIVVMTLLTACAPRGEVVIDPAAAGVGTVEPVYIGTTRGPDGKTPGVYGNARHTGLQFARLDVSIPPDRGAGDIVWPPKRARADPSKADPNTQFVTVSAERYPSERAFQTDLRAALAKRPRGNREAVVFVHGFNNTFAEGAYRMAQLGHDLKLPGVLVHYSWPSKGHPLGYVYDRDSAMFARDGLEELLREVDRAGADRIILVAHSMGSLVLMEAMRQVAIGGESHLRHKIGGVVLVSPDLDVDVFRSQALRIRPLPQPFLIFTSKKDRALSLSARLTGRNQSRLGNLQSAKELADLDVTVLDTTAYTMGTGHFNVGDSPVLLSLMSQAGSIDEALARDTKGRTGLLPGAVLSFQNATEIILQPVAAISGYRN